MYFYTITDESINVTVEGRLFELARTDRLERRVPALVQAASGGDEEAREELQDLVRPGTRMAHETDERIERDPQSGQYYLAGTDKPIAPGLAGRIVDFLAKGIDVEPLINFHKNCLLNPDYDHVQSQLWSFLQYNGHPITPAGYFIAYKRVGLAPYYKREEEEVKKAGYAKRLDLQSGSAGEEDYVSRSESFNPNTGEIEYEEVELGDHLRFVDLYTGDMDNSVGQVVSMEREDVEKDPTRACASGLHVAAMDYIPHYGAGTAPIAPPEGKTWAEMETNEKYRHIREQDSDPVVRVLVNPRHVVSVPYDHDSQKMRTEQYFVLGLCNGREEMEVSPVDYVERETEELRRELDARREEIAGEKEKVADLQALIR
jgi:hypothetical protein